MDEGYIKLFRSMTKWEWYSDTNTKAVFLHLLLNANLEETRYVIVLIILLIIIGSIFVKMDLYLGNPTLALLGYHLYRIKVEKIAESEDLLVISKDKLSLGLSIKWIKITEKVWVVKENKQQ